MDEPARYLNYRPQLDLRRELAFVVRQVGEELSPDYQIPSELEDAASVMATDLAAQVDQLLDAVADLTADLVSCLQTDSGPVSVAEYIKARNEDNTEDMDRFLDHHCSSIGGRAQGELLCFLGDIEDALMDVSLFIRDALMTDPDADAEEARYVALAQQAFENPESLDRLALVYEAQLKYQVQTKLENLRDFRDECQRIATTSANDSFGDDLATGVRLMAGAEAKQMEPLVKVLEAGFVELADRGAKLHQRRKLFGNRQMNRRLQVAAANLRDMRVQEAQPVIDWLGAQDISMEESGASAVILGSALEGLKVIDRELDRTILDLSKHEANEKLIRDELLQNISDRKQARQIRTLAIEVQNGFNRDAPDQEREIERFIEAAGLIKSKSLCAD